MARTRRKHYRCKSCSSPVAVGYVVCGNCGHDHSRRLVVVNSIDELRREFHAAQAQAQASAPGGMVDA